MPQKLARGGGRGVGRLGVEGGKKRKGEKKTVGPRPKVPPKLDPAGKVFGNCLQDTRKRSNGRRKRSQKGITVCTTL